MFDVKNLPPLTSGLIAAAIMVAVASELGTRYGPIEPLFFSWRRIFEGEVWRFITPVFIHFGLMHILFNSIMAYQLGSIVENHKGIAHMAVFVLVTGVLSNLLQAIVGGGTNFGGLSGVVYGFFGYVWMQAQFNRREYIPMDQQFLLIMIGWFALGWTGLVGNIANWAHTGGLVVGVIWGFSVAQMANRRLLRR